MLGIWDFIDSVDAYDTFSEDTFFNGHIRIKQERRGYRFAIDAVLLAHHASPRPGERVLDLGTGCGIIPLMLAFRHPQVKICGIEIQEQLAQLARDNVTANRMEDRIEICCKDMRRLKPQALSGPVDLIVSNPPYRKKDSGRINPDRQKAIAMHEIKNTLLDVTEAARRVLRTAGRLVTIYPAERMTEVVVQFRSSGIEPKRMRMIHSSSADEAKLFVIEGVKGGRAGVKIGPPLHIYQADGSYTSEVAKMFKP